MEKTLREIVANRAQQMAFEQAVAATIKTRGEYHFIEVEELPQQPQRYETPCKWYSVHNFREYQTGWIDRRSTLGVRYQTQSGGSGDCIQILEYQTRQVVAVYPWPRLEFRLFHYQAPAFLPLTLTKAQRAKFKERLPKQAADFAAIWQQTQDQAAGGCGKHGGHRGVFVEVATVRATSPHEVVAITQQIIDDDYWFQSRNPAIRLSLAARAEEVWAWLRSTQMGDVLVLNSTPTSSSPYASNANLALLVGEAAGCFSLLPDCTPIDGKVLFPSCFPAHLD